MYFLFTATTKENHMNSERFKLWIAPKYFFKQRTALVKNSELLGFLFEEKNYFYNTTLRKSK